MAITNNFDIKLLNFLKFKSICFCIFFTANAYSIELVCKGESPLLDPSQRLIYVNCINKGDMEEALFAAMEFIKNKETDKSTSYFACRSDYRKIRGWSDATYQNMSGGGARGSYLMVVCNKMLQKYP
jgi:hypothetical protein